MSCADRFNDAAGDVVFSTTWVRLIHRVELAATACNLGAVSKYIPQYPKYTYIFFMRIVGNVAGVRSVLYKIRPPRPELWILDLAILRFEPEVSINGDNTGGEGQYTQWVHCELIVGSETICPAHIQRVNSGHIWKVPTNLPSEIPSRYILVIFKKCPPICPAHTQQVSGGHFYKVPSTKPSGTGGKNACIQGLHGDYIVIF